MSGSAPLPAHVLDAFRLRFGHTILERYGMSESLMIMSNPYEGDRRAGTVGIPLPGVSARLADEHDAPVRDGGVGEVHVQGPAVFREYWRRADASASAFTSDGWFRTGDLAVRSADGYYTLRGRRGDMIISGGFNIYPREIEELLLEDARVREVAVVGVAGRGPRRGADRVRRGGRRAGCGGVDGALSAQLASFKTPARLRARGRAAAHRAGQGSEASAAEVAPRVSAAALALIAFLIAIALSMTTRVNVGLLAIALAWAIGVYAAHLSAETLIAGFPSGLFLTLAGVTLLFAVAKSNGTLDLVAGQAARAGARQRRAAPDRFLRAGVRAVRHRAGRHRERRARRADRDARRHAGGRAQPAQRDHGRHRSERGQPVAHQRGRRDGQHLDGAASGSPAPSGRCAGATFVVHLLVAIGAYFLFGGARLYRTGRSADATTEAPRFERPHWITIGVTMAWMWAVILFRVNVGLAAFAAATLLILARVVDERDAIRRIPLDIIVMVTGVTMLIGVLEKTGGMDLFTGMIARISSPATLNGVIAFVTGLISTYSSTSGVVLPAFLPMVPGLVREVGGGDPLAVALSINVGSALVDVSPLSTLGALCVATVQDPVEARDLFRKLLIWGFSMAVVGAILCQLLAGPFARL